MRPLYSGAGRAVRGTPEPLLEPRPDLLVIANRTVSRAQDLAREFGDLGEVRACSFEGLNGSRFDILINATSTGLTGELPPLPDHLLTERACCYDLMYGTAPTPFKIGRASCRERGLMSGGGEGETEERGRREIE